MESRPTRSTAGSTHAPKNPADLQQFLAEMRDAHPHQLMEVVAESSLARGIVQATLATVLLLLLATAGPYAWDQFAGHEKADSAATVEAAKTAAATKPAADDENVPAAAEKPKTADAAAKVPAEHRAASPREAPSPISQKALEKLGVDEVKQSDPSVNPLDSKVDDLLDNIK